MSDYDPEKMIEMLFTLLDRIEIEKDYTLARQRFDIAESAGLTVEYGEQVSGRVNLNGYGCASFAVHGDISIQPRIVRSVILTIGIINDLPQIP